MLPKKRTISDEYSNSCEMMGPSKKKRPLDELKLSNLPSDVVREIIKVDPGSINAMQRISPAWDDLSLEYLSNRHRLPSINWMMWKLGYSKFIDPISLHFVPTELQGYFGLNKWCMTWRNSYCEQNYKLAEEVVGAQKDIELQTKVADIVNRVFARASRIHRLDFVFQTNFDDNGKSAMEKHIDIIKRALDSHKAMIIETVFFDLPTSHDQLNLELFQKDLTLIMELVKDHAVTNLTVYMLCNHNIELTLLRDQHVCAFLTEAARLFNSVQLRFQRAYNNSPLFWARDNETKRDWRRAVEDLSTRLKINAEIIFSESDFTIRTSH